MIHELFVYVDWVKVFRQSTKNKKFFSNKQDALNKNPDDPEADLFSILDKLEDYRSSDGRFQFKLCYPEATFKSGKSCNEWIQSSNPTQDDVITDFKPVDLAFTEESYGKPWSGLGRATVGGGALIDDSPKQTHWRSAVGVFNKYYVDRFPGPLELKLQSWPRLVEMFVKKS